MNIYEPPNESKLPLGAAYVAGMASLALTYLFFGHVLVRLEVWWVELLIYPLISISVIFTILYRSCWHTDRRGVIRTISLIWVSGIVFFVQLFSLGIFALAGAFIAVALRHDFDPG